MKCIYPHGVELTKEQIETFEAVCDIAKKIINAIAEVIKTVVESDEFGRVLKLLAQKQEQERIPHHPFTIPPIEIPIPSPPMLDRRLQLPMIRNNC